MGFGMDDLRSPTTPRGWPQGAPISCQTSENHKFTLRKISTMVVEEVQSNQVQYKVLWAF